MLGIVFHAVGLPTETTAGGLQQRAKQREAESGRRRTYCGACCLVAVMFLPRAAGAFMAESGKVDDESLSKEAPTKCPNYNVEDPTRRIWVFTTARSV